MNIKYIIKNNEKIIVSSYSIIPFNNKYGKTLLINGSIYLKVSDKISFKCDKCGKEVIKLYLNLDRILVDNILCKNCLREKSALDKYGVSHWFQLEKNIKRGDTNPMCKKDIRQKQRETLVKKYGVENALQNSIFLQKQQNTLKQRFGVTTPILSKEIKTRIINNRHKNYFDQFINSDKYKNIIVPHFDSSDYNGGEYLYEWECKKCGHIFTDTLYKGKIPRCLNCFPLFDRSSSLQKEVQNYLTEIKINFVADTRKVIKPLELDIYLKDYNFAIEFNGLYWHSELNGKNYKYHYNKTEQCVSKDIFLFQIYEDEWIEKQEIVKSMIMAKLNLIKNTVGARKCSIEEIDSSFEFYIQNHLQGGSNYQINIGLKYNNEIISMMSFRKSILNKKYEWELVRFANKININVIGAFSKLLSFFIKKYNPKNIISYADLRYSYGNVYLKNNFKLDGKTKPDYYYTDYKHRFDRRGFQKQYLKTKLKTYNSELTEWENMQLNGWDRIWDCGNYRFIWENKNGKLF